MTGLLEVRDGDTYYVGDLSAGLALAAEDRYVRHSLVVRDDGTLVHEVLLCDDGTEASAAEWGNGPTREVAERFALGALFGPIDAEYDEAELAANLRAAVR